MLKALYLYLHTYTHTCIYVSKRQTETPCTGLDSPVWESLFPPQMTSAQGVWDLGWLDQNSEHRCLMGSCGRWSGQAVQPANVGVPRVRGGRRSTVAPFENTWGRTREHPGELKGAGTMEEDAKVPQLGRSGIPNCPNLDYYFSPSTHVSWKHRNCFHNQVPNGK